MKYLFMLVLGSLLVACSHNTSLYPFKERDDRNAFVETPLIVPPGITDYLSLNDLHFAPKDLSIDNMVFFLIFSHSLDAYNKQTKSIALDSCDIQFLRKAQSSNGASGIRNKLNEESLHITSKNQNFINKILNWQVNDSL